MIRYLQRNLHTPEEIHRGIVGDCTRTAICCIIERPPWHTSNLVDLMIAHPWRERERVKAQWLARLGYTSYYFGLELEDMLKESAIEDLYESPGPGYHLIHGRSLRGTGHTVVGLDGRIIWDPGPNQTGLLPSDCGENMWLFEKLYRLTKEEIKS